jgi:hypothetical protein
VPARGVTNRRHNADITVIITVLLLRAEGLEQRPAGFSTGPSRRCGRAQRHDSNHILDEDGLDVYDSGPLG